MPKTVLKLSVVVALSATTVTGSGAAQDPVQRPRFGATVARVKVDVIVSRDNGFIEDLTAGEFRVFEDGNPVRVLGVELVDLTRGSAPVPDEPASPARTAEPGADPAARQALTPSLAGGAAGQAPGAMVFLIDIPSLSPNTKARFVDAWARILDATEMPEVPRAAYSVDHRGRIVELAALGADTDALLAAADKAAALPIFSERRADQLIDMVSDLPRPSTTTPGAFEDAFGQVRSVAVASRPAVAKMRIFENEERRRALSAFDLLTAFADALWVIEGRTTLVWVSSGVRLMQAGPTVAALAAFEDAAQRTLKAPSAEEVPGIRQLRAGLTSPDLRVMERQQRLFEAANSANVSIYAIDPTLLIEVRMPGVDARLGGGGFREALSDPLVIGALDAMGDSLRTTAEATGGRAFVHATDLGAALREIEADASRYYLITYAPPRGQADGDYHEIRVEVDRPGVNVRWRRGYLHLTDSERRQRNANAARLVPGLVAEASAMALARQAEEQRAEAVNVSEEPPAAVPDQVPATTPEAAVPDPTADARGGAATASPTGGRLADAPVARPAEIVERPVEAEERPPTDPRVLRLVLDHLAQTARFYRARALTFACDETIIASTYNASGGFRRRDVYELQYIYTFEDPPEDAPPDTIRRLRDYRTRRDAEAAPGDAPEEVRLESLDLPVATMRAYSWAFLFQEGLQSHYRFDLVDQERALDRDALVIAFDPVPPVVAGFNDWFGRAWIDAETYQVLRIEALQAGDYAELDAIEQDRVTLNVPRDGRLVVRLEAEFAVEERGVRLPSRVTLTGEDFSMRALAFGLPGGISSVLPEWRLRGRVVFRVEQVYDEYRFFEVEVRSNRSGSGLSAAGMGELHRARDTRFGSR